MSHAIVVDMPKSSIQAVRCGLHTFASFITKPGYRYATHREGNLRPGRWVRDDEAVDAEWCFVFHEPQVSVMLPLLRELEGRAAGKGGRRAAKPTTADGKLIARACERLKLSTAGLAAAIGAHESVLSRARTGELPQKHQAAIKALLKRKASP